MVVQRFLETLMDPYQYEATQVILKVEEYQFKHAENVTRKLDLKHLVTMILLLIRLSLLARMKPIVYNKSK